MTPPIAGPMARETLKPMLLSAIAACNCGRGTISGTSDCWTGAIAAVVTPASRRPRTRRVGDIHPARVTSAMPSITQAPAAFSHSSRRRLFTMSASAPAGSQSRKIGKVVATCTIATAVAEADMVVISQPAPTSRIQVPMLPRREATHSTAKTRWPNGAQGDAPPTAAAALGRSEVTDIRA